MVDAPYPLALAAGVLAAVNPCGFALLPAYVSLLVVDGTGGRQQGVGTALVRALSLTAAMTLGFLIVFGGFGLLAAPAADWLAQRLPWLTVVIGLVLAILGGWLLLGRDLPSPVPKPARAPQPRQRFASMVLFGMSFAIASLGCTIGPFLAVVVTSFGTRSAAAGVALFLAYAAGMALVVGTVALAVALAQQSVLRAMRRLAPMLSRGAGLLMILAGAYIAWYGWYEIRLFRHPGTTDPLIDAGGQAQTRLAAFVDNLGAATIALVLLALVVFAGGTALWRRSRRP
jgi:cytochrome c biogenesis protein CcdA